MEYGRDGNLSNYVSQRGKLTEPEARHFFVQVRICMVPSDEQTTVGQCSPTLSREVLCSWRHQTGKHCAPLTNQTGSATVTTTYSPYDGLHRLKGKTYSNGDPAVSYTYDQANCLGLPSCFNVGRRTAMSDASGSTAWSYDQMGRTWTEQRTIGTVAKNIGYTYNLAGSLATLTYPSGRTLTYKYEAAGRPSTLRDVPNGINYVTGATIGTPCSGEDGNGACYAPHGALATMVNGYTSSFAGITTTNSYDKRLQPAILSASAPSQTVFSLSYDFHLGTGDNGNVFQIVNNRDNTRTQAFTYDTLNRIATAQTPNSNLWGASYVIDAWGNLTNMNQNPQKTYGDNLQAAPATTATNSPATATMLPGT